MAVPTAWNGNTLTVKFNDNDAYGPDWYECKLIFEIADNPANGTLLTGAVALEGVLDLGEIVTPVAPLTFEFRAPGTTTAVLPPVSAVLQPIPGTPYGTFRVLVPPGTYDIAVKEAHTLRRVFANVHVDGQQTLTNGGGFPFVLHGGDATNHNAVGMEDFETLLESYSADGAESAGKFNAAADFNHDGKVDFLDFEILLRNYDRAGAD